MSYIVTMTYKTFRSLRIIDQAELINNSINIIDNYGSPFNVVDNETWFAFDLTNKEDSYGS